MEDLTFGEQVKIILGRKGMTIKELAEIIEQRTGCLLYTSVQKKQIKKFQADMLSYFDTQYPEIGQEIEEKQALTDEMIEKIVETAKEFKKSRC